MNKVALFKGFSYKNWVTVFRKHLNSFVQPRKYSDKTGKEIFTLINILLKGGLHLYEITYEIRGKVTCIRE
jgi:hypothetical protein